MRNFFIGLTIILFFVGFLFLPAFIFAIITLILAIASSPLGLRADGKSRSGGLFGGLWDYIAIKEKMKTCPYCKELILRNSLKCRYCGEWFDDQIDDEIDQEFIETLYKNLKSKNTHELLSTWNENDRKLYTNEYFEATKKILLERGESISLKHEAPQGQKIISH